MILILSLTNTARTSSFSSIIYSPIYINANLPFPDDGLIFVEDSNELEDDPPLAAMFWEPKLESKLKLPDPSVSPCESFDPVELELKLLYDPPQPIIPFLPSSETL